MSGMRTPIGEPENSLNTVAPVHEMKLRLRARPGAEKADASLRERLRYLSEKPLPQPAKIENLDAAERCVAVIEPDKTYRKAMTACLSAKGFRVLEFAAADSQCIPVLAKIQAGVALINAEALRDEGEDFLQRLRAQAPRLQLAVVAEQGDAQFEERLLAAGAADFFSRGCSAAVIAKRLSLLVEGARGVEVAGVAGASDGDADEEEIEAGPLTLRLASHRALWEGQELPLTVTEFRIVRLLAASGEEGASYRGIYDVVHGEGFNAGDGPDGFRTNVRSLVRRIRRKFCTVEPSFSAIENLPGRGYRWRSPAVSGDALQTEASAAAAPRGPRHTLEKSGAGLCMNDTESKEEVLQQASAPERTVYPVILCGGSGKRLWPVSRKDCPKQFQRLSSERSLLQETVLRARDTLGLGAPILLCNEDHRFLVAEHLAEIGVGAEAILCEPAPRNTAPALAAAAALLHEKDPEGLMLAMPADHHIGDPEAFAASVAKGQRAAELGYLVTFGIAPDRPETGYGYIEEGGPLDGLEEGKAVNRFMEKPSREAAEELLAEGRYLWNSGIFLMPVAGFLDELGEHAPDCASASGQAVKAARHADGVVHLDGEAFAAAPDVSVDVAVMERTRRAAVVRADMAWSDIGTWPALRALRGPDANGNVLDGNAVTEDVSNCLIQANGRLVAAVGLKDLVIVDTEDAVLISDAEQTAKVDRLVARLKESGQGAAEQHAVVQRPWGHYQTVESGQRFQVKHILVKPGEKLSLQMHHHRAEHWIVVSGTGRVTCDEETRLLHENESLHIPVGSTHSLENPGKIPLHLIEVQVGTYLGEDDIVRFEDRYGRG